MERVVSDDTPDNRATLFELLLSAELLFATAEGPEEERTEITTGDEEFTLLALPDDQGRVWPVFTSETRMLDWRPEGCGYLGMDGRTLFETALANDVVRLEINPASAKRGFIERWEIEVLARGRLPLAGQEVMPAGTQLKIGTATAMPPAEVIDTVVEAVAAEPSAVEARLFLVQQEPGPPERAVAVAFDEGLDEDARSELLDAIIQRAGERSAGARGLAYLPLDGPFLAASRSGLGRLLFRR